MERKSKEWEKYNISELEKRALSISEFYSGYMIVLRPKKKISSGRFQMVKMPCENEIVLVKGNYGVKFSTLGEVLNYSDLVSAGSLAERIELYQHAVQKLKFFFFVDYKLINLIKFGE